MRFHLLVITSHHRCRSVVRVRRVRQFRPHSVGPTDVEWVQLTTVTHCHSLTQSSLHRRSLDRKAVKCVKKKKNRKMFQTQRRAIRQPENFSRKQPINVKTTTTITPATDSKNNETKQQQQQPQPQLARVPSVKP